MDEQNQTRIRTNVKQGAKGGVTLEVTSEATTVREAILNFGQAWDELKSAVEARGLRIAAEG
jgi:hypothetical protein